MSVIKQKYADKQDSQTRRVRKKPLPFETFRIDMWVISGLSETWKGSSLVSCFWWTKPTPHSVLSGYLWLEVLRVRTAEFMVS